MASGDPLLSVRIDDGAGHDRLYRFRDLSWRDTAAGGWASLQVTVIADDLTDLGPNDHIWVYDNAGETLFEGYLDNPGVTKGPRGSEYQITATGPGGLASDAAHPYIVVDTALERWTPSQYSTKGAVLGTADIDDDTACLQVTAPKDTEVTVAGNVTFQTALVTTDRWTGDFKYGAIRAAGQQLARIVATFRGGVNDSDFLYGIRTRTGSAGSTDWVASHTSGVTPATLFAKYGDADFGATDDVGNLRVSRYNSDTTGAEEQIFQIYNITVRALLKNADGTDITTGYTSNTVLASAIVTDMVGRGLLPGLDSARISIETTSDGIDQFAFPDGITGAGALEALVVYEPDMVWTYGPSSGAGHSFDYRAWDDTDARYELDDERDGVTLPGGDNELCNRIIVAWTDRKGRPKTTTVGAYVPALGNKNPVLSNGTIDPTFIGRIRDADTVSIPAEFGTETGAARLGAAILARSATPPRAGTALVRRPILDQSLGRLVMPGQIRAGYSVRLRSTGELLRLTEVGYDHDSRAASLTLGSPTLTVEQLLADMTKRSPILTAKQVTPGLLTAIHKLKGKKG